jgi:predicted nucleic acid-binding protein
VVERRRRVLVDTGPLVSILSQDDEHHERCVEEMKVLPAPLLTCWPVLTEAAWLLRRQRPALQGLFRLFADGMCRLVELDPPALPWIAAFLQRYESIEAQLADAALVYLAEREDIRKIFTLNRRDFTVYRIKKNQRFEIVPANPS